MAGPVIGFHGKLPARGDFVTRGLPSSFLSAWEAWVDGALAASRALLGEAWREAWMTAPVWRFCLPAGACGPDPALGVMMPSIDRVGRLYPLTVVVLLPGATGTPDADAADALLDHAEDAGRSALAEGLDPDALRDLIAGIPIDVATQPGMPAVWWTDGSHAIDPMSLSLDGLPAMPEHAAMLAGEPGATADPEAAGQGEVAETGAAPADAVPAETPQPETPQPEPAQAEPAGAEAPQADVAQPAAAPADGPPPGKGGAEGASA